MMQQHSTNLGAKNFRLARFLDEDKNVANLKLKLVYGGGHEREASRPVE